MGHQERRGKVRQKGSQGEVLAFPSIKGENPPSEVTATIAPETLIRHLTDLAKFQQHIESRLPTNLDDPSHSLRVGSLESLQTNTGGPGQIILRDKKVALEQEESSALGELRKFPHERGGSKT